MTESVGPEVLLAHAAWVRRLARRLVEDEHAAADLEQETWFAALLHAPSGGSLRAWLSEVARNLAHRSRRARARRIEREERAARAEAQSGADELVERADLLRTLAGHVLALDEPCRSTLLLRYFEELSPGAIARKQGVPVRTVKTRLQRGLAKLRERLDASPRRDRESRLAALTVCVAERPSSRPLLELIAMKMQTKVAAALAAAALVGSLAWIARPRADELEARPLASAAFRAPETPPGSPPNRIDEPRRDAVAAEPSPPVPAESPEVAEEPPSAIRGRVRDRDGRPIAGAEIAAMSSSLADLNWNFGADDSPFATVTTRASGEFELVLAPSRAANLAISAPGLGTAQFARRRAGDVVDAVLEASGSIEGRVLARDGSGPVEGATVTLRATENAAYNPALARATTGARGEYRIDDLGARDFWVSAAAPGCGASTLETVTVRAAETATKDFEVEVGAVFRIRGRVLDALDRAPIAGAEVYRGDARTTSGAQGAFELAIVAPRGAKTIAANVRVPGCQVAEASVLTAEAAEREVEVLLERDCAVGARVVSSDGRAIVGAQVQMHSQGAGTATGRSSEGGSFDIGGLRPGARYALHVRADGFATAAFDLPALPAGLGARLELGDVVLAPAASLSGRIVDERGRPWDDCPVELAGENADRSRFTAHRVPGVDARIARRNGETDADGRFVFGELARGEYVLKARLAGRPAMFERSVSIAEAESAEIEIVVPRGLSIAGRVLDPEGNGVSSVFVRVEPLGAPGTMAGSDNTGSDGAFDIAGLEPGSYELTTMFSPVSPASVSQRCANARMRIEAGAVAFDLALPLASEISGRLLADDGSPRAGETVLAFAVPDDSTAEGNARTNASGEFRLQVRKGITYRLRLLAPDGRATAADALASSSALADGVAGGTRDLELRAKR